MISARCRPAVVSAFTVLAIVVLSASAATAAVERTEGAASVSVRGAAQYAIPLKLPPGVNGLTPELALSYSHNTDNGLIGIGWAISGLSEIARCNKSIAFDGGGWPIDLTANDAYCLGGNRLRHTSGAYGQASSTYQTLVETYSRATATSANSNGPMAWEVRKKDGLIYEYGATTDSRIETVGSPAVRAWALNKIIDRSGNSIEFVYEEGTSGSYRPFEVRYGRNEVAGTPHTTKAVFVYEPGTRPDPIYSFQSSPNALTTGPVHEFKRLDRIDVVDIATSTTVRTYELTYDPTGGAGNRSRLSSIQESVNGDTLLPTQITWTTGTPGWSSSSTIATGVMVAGLLRGDINGDNRTDIIFSSSTASGGGTWRYMLGTEAGLGPVVDTTIPNYNYASAQLVEWNGDGRLDVLVPCNGTNTWCVMVATGSGFLPLSNTSASSVGLQLVNDFNCDGLDDLVRIEKSSLPNRLFTRVRSGSGFAAETLAWTSPISIFKVDNFGPTLMARERGSQRTLDFNGDHCGDFLISTYDDDPEPGTQPLYSLTAFLGSNSGIAEANRALGEQNTPITVVAVGDFNGDGHTDLLRSYGSMSFAAYMGTGGLFAGPVQGPARADYYDDALFVADYDGDGLDDIGMHSFTTGTLHVSRSTGSAFVTAVDTGTLGAAATRPADINGDGGVDLVSNLATTDAYYWLHNPAFPDFVDRITDGFEMYVDFDYVRLSNSGSVYTKGTGAVFPTIDYEGSMYVVSRMTSTTGTGSTYEMTYQYEGGRQHLQGHGFLGFARRVQTDGRNNVRTEESYLQDVARWEVLGSPSTVQVRQSDGTLMAETLLTWGVLPAGSGATERRFPYVASQVARRYEVGGSRNGALISMATTTAEDIDEVSGFIYDSRTVVQEADSANGLQPDETYEQRTYHTPGMLSHDTSGWCIGRPGQTQQTNSHGQYGGTAITRTTNRTWDLAKCRMTQEIAEPGHPTRQVVTDIGYDAFGNVNSRGVTGRNPDGTAMALRSNGANWGTNGRFLRWTTNPLSQPTLYGWDEKLGLRTSLTDPNQLQTSWVYDDFGRLTRENRPDGTATTISYNDCATDGCLDANNKLIVKEEMLDTNGVTVREQRTYLDRFKRQLATRSTTLATGEFSRVERRYDPFGRVSQESAPCAWAGCSYFWTDYSYDAANRVTQVSRPTSEMNSTPVNAYLYYEGLTTRRVDPQNKQSTEIDNVIGQLLRATNHDGYHIQHDYDAFSNPVRVTDSAGATLQTDTFDLRGLRTASSITGAGTRNYTYNSLGEIRSQQDSKSQTTTLDYDPLGRPTYRADAQGTTMLDWGDSAPAKNIGRLESKTGPTGVSENYVYDTFGRPLQTTIALGADGSYLINYSYNALGMLDTLTYPTSTSSYRLTLKYEYANAQLQRIRDNASSTVFWAANGANPRGQITRETLGNGLVTTHGFDAVTGNPGFIRTGPGGGNATQNLSYLWDAMGNLTQRQDGNQGLTEDLYYDNLYRIDYSQLDSTTNLDVGYNARGNITSKLDNADSAPQGGNATWLANDLPDTLSATLPQGSSSSQFFYDADRNRYKQVASQGGSTETILYIGGLLERVTVGSVTTFRHYIPTPTGLAAIYLRNSSGTNTTYYTLRDHLGSMDKITNATGDVTVALSYSAYGQRRGANWAGSPSASDWTHINAITHRGFTGHEHLDHVGLIHMNGRVYQPSLGRFISSDPFIDAMQGTQAFNRYAYLGNGPLSSIDPSGFSTSMIRPSSWNAIWFLGNRGFLMERAGGRSIVRPREPRPPKAAEASTVGEEQSADSWRDWYTEQLFAEPMDCGADGGGRFPNVGAGVNFNDACVHHDACYGTYGASRATCDLAFRNEIIDIFEQAGQPLAARPLADQYYLAVRIFGANAYKAAQMANEPRWVSEARKYQNVRWSTIWVRH